MFTLNCRGRLVAVEAPMVWGVINVTPDSFYAGSRFEATESILTQVEKMLAEGADMIEIGAQSTRPQSQLLSVDEELNRLAKVVEMIVARFPDILISVDTFYGKVAEECVLAGASVVNDISGGQMDEHMLDTVAKLQVPFVCMHLKGTPQTMMQHSRYTNLLEELIDHFVARLESCRAAGIQDVILDPGFGFSKNAGHNFELLKKLELLKVFGKPVMAGISRKSTIYKTLGITPAEALNGSTVLHTIALLNGADILRVHDVKEARECVTLVQAFKGGV